MAVGEVLLGHRVEVDLLLERAQRLALGLQGGLDLLLEDPLVEQVLDADAQPRGLVGVAGADSALGGADRVLAQLLLALEVEHQVVGHDHVGVGGQLQPADVHAPLAQAVDLGGQYRRVDDDAVADDAQAPRVEDARGDQVELVRLATADDGVAGVVPTLEADDDVRTFGKEVDDLALALIAPLGAHDNGARHFRPRSLGGPT